MLEELNILITGCTSTIGKSIVKEFAPNNSLILISRNTSYDNLLQIKENALSLGSNNVTLIVEDLGELLNEQLN